MCGNTDAATIDAAERRKAWSVESMPTQAYQPLLTSAGSRGRGLRPKFTSKVAASLAAPASLADDFAGAAPDAAPDAAADCAAASAAAAASSKATRELVALCLAHVALNTSGPILLHWVKEQHGGKQPFSAAALTFHAYAGAVFIGLGWVGSQGAAGFRQLWRPSMLLRCCLLAALFSSSDTLNVLSLQQLDPGTFSLVGKALSMVFTVALSRFLLGRCQSKAQHSLVALIVLSTLAFCREEQLARQRAIEHHASASVATSGAGERRGDMDPVLWAVALMQRIVAVLLCSTGSVLQERLLVGEVSVHYLLQQTWMGGGAVVSTFFTWRCMEGAPLAELFTGLSDWRVLLALTAYTLNGLTSGLVVKRLGALAKALCVPIHLGTCYVYSVSTGNATLEPAALAAWLASASFVVLFGLSKAFTGRNWAASGKK